MMLTRQELSLIKELTLSDFKLRYKNSVLGFLWSLLKPLSMLITLYIVFRLFIRLESPDYALSLLLGIVIWNFFAEGTSSGLNSINAKAGIVKKIHFRYEILVISACLTALLSFLLTFILALLLIFIVKGGFSIIALYSLMLILELFFIMLGLSLVLSVFFVYYKDIGHMWDVMLNIGFWLNPVAYPITFIPERYLGIYMSNPLARIITAFRDILLKNYLPSIQSLIITFIISLAILLIGFLIYKSKAGNIAEDL